jgi:hypothetical protein
VLQLALVSIAGAILLANRDYQQRRRSSLLRLHYKILACPYLGDRAANAWPN